jgi:hypothetical protein
LNLKKLPSFERRGKRRALGWLSNFTIEKDKSNHFVPYGIPLLIQGGEPFGF